MKRLVCIFVISLFLAVIGDEEIDYEDLTAREAENADDDQSYNVPIYGLPPKPTESESPIDDYNEDEIAFIRGLQSIGRGHRRGLIHYKFKPRCYFENWTGACCINFNSSIADHEIYECKTCIETGIRLDKMEVFAGLYFNEHRLYEKDFDIGKLCWSLPPPLSKIRICYWVYHLNIDLKKHRFESCALLEVTPYFHVGFNCLLYEDGHFSIHDRIQPEHKGLVNIHLLGGKLEFQVESPVGKRVKYWFKKQWAKFKALFKRKSAKFIAWLKRK